MKNLLIFNLGRRSRTLAAPALALAALAILLLGIGSELPTASASALPPARLENATSAISSYIYFPIIFYTETPAVNWVDEFTSSKTGWIASGDGCTGKYDGGRYKVTISSGHKNKSCIIWNSNPTNSPLYPFPQQFEGTFRVKVQRTSSNSYPLMYGLQFDTAANSSDTNGTRWALEVWPQATDSDCNDDKGFYWLTAQQYKSSSSRTDKYFSPNSHDDDPPGDSVDGCTDAIDRGEDDWNQMTAIRSGNTVAVYLNNYDDSNKKSHSFTSVPTIYPKDHSEALGWTQMRVVSYSSSQVTVEFERIEILSSTTPPW
jgi:hypothetical protein